MSVNFIAFLIGLVGVPIALLAYGHRLRKRSARGQGIFWWAVIGYCVAGTLAVIIAMIPPEAWTQDETIRGLLGFWGLLLIPLAAAIVRVAMPPRSLR